MSIIRPAIICIILLCLMLMSDVSDTKCTCCNRINDYCCQTLNEKDACCDLDGNIEDKEKHDWSKEYDEQCEKYRKCIPGSCPIGQYCDSGVNCVTGCTAASTCPPETSCDLSSGDIGACSGKCAPGSCPIGQYCENGVSCIPGCTAASTCPPGTSCDLASGDIGSCTGTKDCKGMKCGTLCQHPESSDGIFVCDKQEKCRDIVENPCAEDQECQEKNCGDECLMGDVKGICDAKGDCKFGETIDCEQILEVRKVTK